MEYTFVLGVTLGLLVVSVRAEESSVKGLESRSEPLSDSSFNQPWDECVHQLNDRGSCLVLGAQSPYQTLVYHGEEKKFEIPFITRTTEFNFVLNNSLPYDYITYVEVINNMEPSKRGYVTLTKGGAGRRDVTLFLESQRGEGYDFSIRIYAVEGQQQQQQPNYPDAPIKEPYDYPGGDYEPYIPVDPVKGRYPRPQKVGIPGPFSNK